MAGGTLDELIKQGLLPPDYQDTEVDELETIGTGGDDGDLPGDLNKDGVLDSRDFIAGDPVFGDPAVLGNIDQATTVDTISIILQNMLQQWGEDNGESAAIMNGIFLHPDNHAAVEDFVGTALQQAQNQTDLLTAAGYQGDFTQFSTLEWYGTAEGLNVLVENTWNKVFGSSFGDFEANVKRGPVGRTGPRRATPQEIRNRFDIDQLAEQAQNIWRGKLLEDMDNPTQLAREFVEAIVATRGEKVIDFGTFVEKRARLTPRYASVYRNKVEGMSDEQFLQPYFQASQQILRPKNAAGTAVRGAQFGASAGQFGELLAQSNEVKTSAPYIQELGGRMSALKNVFAGS